METRKYKSKSEIAEECQVCYQPAHGRHFGIDSCRACAAFFRRYYNPQCGKLKLVSCRKTNNKCEPGDNGRWYCKKCRLNKCIRMGMVPDKVQHDRDLNSSSMRCEVQSRKRAHDQTVPLSMERKLGKPHLVLWLKKERSPNQEITFFDFNSLIEKLNGIFDTVPHSIRNKSYNPLKKLSIGLRDIRQSERTENLVSFKTIGKMETVSSWENGFINFAKWLTYCEHFNNLRVNDKMRIVKCMWPVFSNLNRVSMTADMRRKRSCRDTEFLLSEDILVDFSSSKFDVEWLSDLPMEQLEFFLGPVEKWYKTELVDEFVSLNPTETELAFLIATLCLQLAGQELGGRVQECTDRVQEVLADNLHEYYYRKNCELRYSYRLGKLLSVNKEYKRTMFSRRDNVIVGVICNAFSIDFSHREMFKHVT